MIKFKTFCPHIVNYGVYEGGNRYYDAATSLNNWLEENANVEILNWHTCSSGKANELYITIQYKEN